MRVLFCCRDLSEWHGGDATQIRRTKAELEQLGITVDLSFEDAPDVSSYDLVHVFTLQIVCIIKTFRQILNAKQQGKPVAFSTIYWGNKELSENPQEAMAEKFGLKTGGLKQVVWYKAKNLLKRADIELMQGSTFRALVGGFGTTGATNAYYELQRAAILLSDIILPNTTAESELVESEFGITPKRSAVIPNAAETSFVGASPDWFIEKYGLRDFVLCAGRIGHRKNQLSLLRAVKDTGLKLVLVGAFAEPIYAELCRQEAKDLNGDVLFIGHTETHELASIYAAAKVHALVSFYETPGIASLEAGLAGCNLVATPVGGVREYLGDFAWWCSATDEISIRDAILKAHAAPRNPQTSQHIRENFTWPIAAQKTLDAYHQVLSSPLSNQYHD